MAISMKVIIEIIMRPNSYPQKYSLLGRVYLLPPRYLFDVTVILYFKLGFLITFRLHCRGLSSQ